MCRQLADLGTKAAKEGWGVERFTEVYRDTHTFTRRTGRLPEQRVGDQLDFRSLLHRDGSVLSFVPLQVTAPCHSPSFCRLKSALLLISFCLSLIFQGFDLTLL